MREPTDEKELMARAYALGGRTIEEVAQQLGMPIPDLSRAKGFVGQLVEHALGATGRSKAQPDFESLGVELKTLPIDRRGQVRQSTFVCSAPLRIADEAEWETSRVRMKLARVLFVIVEGEPTKSARERRMGAAFLWSPSESEEARLRADWEDLTGRIGAGAVEELLGEHGEVLQLRPKGKNRQARTRAFDAEGAPFMAPRRAFYLRRQFTMSLLRAEGLL